MQKEKHWSRFADDFEKRVIYVAGEHNIMSIKKNLDEQCLKGRVLELGCGNGTYSRTLAENADALHATDFSDQMVGFCQNRLNGHANIAVEKQDCLNLKYNDEEFDAVVMVNLLHIIPDPKTALKEAPRVLKKGGILVVISFTSSGMSFFAKLGMIYRYFRAWGKPPAGSRVLTVDSTRTMLEKAGFSVVMTDLMGEGVKAVFARAVAL